MCLLSSRDSHQEAAPSVSCLGLKYDISCCPGVARPWGCLGVLCTRPPELRSVEFRLSQPFGGPGSGGRVLQRFGASYLGVLRCLREQGGSPLSLQAPCCLTPAIYPRFKLQAGLGAKSQPTASWLPLRRRPELPAGRAWPQKPTEQQAPPGKVMGVFAATRRASPCRRCTFFQLLFLKNIF